MPRILQKFIIGTFFICYLQLGFLLCLEPPDSFLISLFYYSIFFYYLLHETISRAWFPFEGLLLQIWFSEETNNAELELVVAQDLTEIDLQKQKRSPITNFLLLFPYRPFLATPFLACHEDFLRFIFQKSSSAKTHQVLLLYAALGIEDLEFCIYYLFLFHLQL